MGPGLRGSKAKTTLHWERGAFYLYPALGRTLNMLHAFDFYNNKYNISHCAGEKGEAEIDSVICPRPPTQEVATGLYISNMGVFVLLGQPGPGRAG